MKLLIDTRRCYTAASGGAMRYSSAMLVWKEESVGVDHRVRRAVRD